MNEIIEKIKDANSLEELKSVMIEFVERYQYHFHKTQLPTSDPYNPFLTILTVKAQRIINA